MSKTPFRLPTLPLLMCCLAALVTACNSNPSVPSSQPLAEGPQSQMTVTGNARNSAKIHTELGALYFQDGQLATALEELRIAIAADSSYAPAHNVLGLRLARKLGDRAEEASYNAQLRRRFPGSRETQALLKGNFE